MTIEQLIIITLNFYGFLFCVGVYYLHRDLWKLHMWCLTAEHYWEKGIMPPLPGPAELQAEANCQWAVERWYMLPMFRVASAVTWIRHGMMKAQ